MKTLTVAVLLLAVMTAATTTLAQQQAAPAKPRILVHLTSGPENPTKAALAFLVARTAVEQGHAVSMFLTGDAVQLLRDSTLDGLTGVGTGKLREHFDIIAKGGGRFYLSGMSSSARGISALELQGKPAELSPPTVLLKLSLDHDRMFTY
jgi:predicted peroxiredoxin